MMGAFLYGTALQWRLDIRSRTLLITCYVVPLLFFEMCIRDRFCTVHAAARTEHPQDVHAAGIHRMNALQSARLHTIL